MKYIKYIKITPLDTLFFNTGKPFNKGEDTWVNSLKFPYPSVVWGALASHFFASGKEADDLRKELKISGVYLYNENSCDVLIPAPLDIFVDDFGKIHTEKYITAKEFEKDGIITNTPFLEIVQHNTDNIVENQPNGLINLLSLENYANKNKNYLHLHNVDEWIVDNPKVGIQRENETSTSQENMLYRVDMQEFNNDLSFVVEVNTKYEFETKGILKLGGEGKVASFECIEIPYEIKKFTNEIVPKIEKEIERLKFVKVLFTSPVIANDNLLKYNDNEIELATTLLGKPLYIGGWDYEKREPKPMLKAFPAGSVLTFNVLKEMNINYISTKIADIVKTDYQGFGLFKLLNL